MILELFGYRRNSSISDYVAATIIIVVSIWLLIRLVIKRYVFVKPFADIPGPSSIPIIGNAFQLTGSQADFFQTMIKYSTPNDSMFRLWIGQKPFVFIYKAEAVQPLLSSSSHIDKSLEYKLLHELLGNGLITATGSRWHRHRKLLTPVFHYSALETYLQSTKNVSEILANRLTHQIGQLPFNIIPLAKAMALDLICEITMGYRLNSQLNSNLDYVHAIDELMAIAQRRFITPWLKPNCLFKLSSYSRKHYKSLDVVMSFSSKIIQERKKKYFNDNPSTLPNEDNNFTNIKDNTFLDLLLKTSENGSLLNDNDIQEEVNTFVFAGHDTTAMAISWALYTLGLYPEVQDKIVEELNKELPEFGVNRLTTGDLSKLNYLECCIKETLRLYPIVPLIARYLTSPIKISNRDLPAGTTILVNTYTLHRDHRYFPDPNTFIPERFSSDSKGNRNPFSYIPFSAGLRNCIGQKLAMMSMKIIIATILKRLRIKTITTERELKLVAEVTLTNEDGIHISVEPRN